MFTRQYYKTLGCIYNAGYTSMVIKNAVGDTKTVNDVMNKYHTVMASKLQSFIKYPKSNANSGVAFGDGNAPVTLDDYQLSGEHIITFDGSTTFTVSDDFTTITYVYTLTNTGTSAFTIKEVGVFSTANYSDAAILMLREVLDSPVTIEPGGVGQVSLSIKVNIPEA